MTETMRATPADAAPRKRFAAQCPGLFYLDPDCPDDLDTYLHRAGVLSAKESVTTALRAGEGNMNCTLRVTTNARSLIVKQARPWVEKYPQFAAPWDRALREIEFYRLVADKPQVTERMPRLLHADLASHLLVLEDVGIGSDLTSIYQGSTLATATVDQLADYLTALHHGFHGQSAQHPLTNREMRALNHAHIFQIPLEHDNGLHLDDILPGLHAAAVELRSNPEYVAAVRGLGTDVYLADGECLVHGDFFPGSFLNTPAGVKVIDPEFGCFGRPEVDAGMFLAHLLLGRQPPAVADRFLNRYLPPADYSVCTMLQLAGAEVMRRLIGYAQLPLGCGLSERCALLALSKELVMRPRMELTLMRNTV
jgi:5-methylthioribose kinase